jgi:hypothetical protein
MLAFTLSACGQAPSGTGSLTGLDGLDPSIAELFNLELEEGLDIEPNDIHGQAKELVPGSFQGQVDYPADTDDFYYVDLQEDQTLEVVITFPHREGDLDLMMVTDNLDYLKISSSETDVEYMAVTAPVAERYFVVVSGALFRASNSYRLGVQISEPGMGRCENDDDEPNDIQEEAKAVDWTVNRWQWWNRTHCEGEEDW